MERERERERGREGEGDFHFKEQSPNLPPSTDHQNFFGTDENNGPIAVSLRREKVSDDLANYFDTPSTLVGQQAPLPKHQYRVIVRTSEVCTCTCMSAGGNVGIFPGGQMTGGALIFATFTLYYIILLNG